MSREPLTQNAAGREHTEQSGADMTLGLHVKLQAAGLQAEQQGRDRTDRSWTEAFTGIYSEELLGFIRTEEEAIYYLALDLQEWRQGQFHSLIRPIDWESNGGYNRQRVLTGHAPVDLNTGQVIELHHIGQRRNSPLAELTGTEHRSRYANNLLHSGAGRETIHRNQFQAVRRAYWMNRMQSDIPC